MFSQEWKIKLRLLFTGMIAFVACLCLFGFPDTLFGKGNILYYLYNNIIESPQIASNINLTFDPLFYLITRHYPLMFGYGLMVIFIMSFFLLIYQFVKNGFRKSLNKYKIELFLLACLSIFILSLFTIKINSAGNRTLVLLPFLVLISSLVYTKVFVNYRRFLAVITVLLILIQVYISASWVYIKMAESPQAVASEWVQRNIPKGQIIGLENIPIYQGIPDIIQKEFYFHQYKIDNKNIYNYEIVHAKSGELPSVIVITNDEIENKLLIKSSKRDLVKRMEKEGYKKIVVFSPDFTYYKVFGTDVDYYISGIVTSPLTTSVYKK